MAGRQAPARNRPGARAGPPAAAGLWPRIDARPPPPLALTSAPARCRPPPHPGPRPAAGGTADRGAPDAEHRGDLAAGRCQERRHDRPQRPRLGHARALLRRAPLLRRAQGGAGGARLPRHPERRRHPHCGDGRGRRGRAGNRHPRRIRRPARPQPGGGRGRAQTAGIGRQRPWLRPQPARRRLAACGHCGEGLAGRQRRQGTGALLWLPGRGRRRGQGLHGAGRRLLRRGRGDFLAPCRLHRSQRAGFARQHAHRLQAAAHSMPSS